MSVRPIAKELVVRDRAGTKIAVVAPVQWVQIWAGLVTVDNGYTEQDIDLPEGATIEIKETTTAAWWDSV